jgi:hypothetical protein
MKHLRTIILLLLILAVLVVSCDGQLNQGTDPSTERELNQDNYDAIAYLGVVVMTHTTLHFEPNLPIDIDWENSLEILITDLLDPVNMTADISWDNFDVGASIKYLASLEGNNGPLFQANNYRLFDFIEEGQLIVNGSATTLGNPAEVTLEIELEINDLDFENAPNGTYTIELKLQNFNPDNIGGLTVVEALVNDLEAEPDISDLAPAQDPD